MVGDLPRVYSREFILLFEASHDTTLYLYNFTYGLLIVVVIVVFFFNDVLNVFFNYY